MNLQLGMLALEYVRINHTGFVPEIVGASLEIVCKVRFSLVL